MTVIREMGKITKVVTAVIAKTDLTDYAIKLGVWDALCEMAGVDPKTTEEVEATEAKEV